MKYFGRDTGLSKLDLGIDRISPSSSALDGKLVVGLDAMLRFHADAYMIFADVLGRLGQIGESLEHPQAPVAPAGLKAVGILELFRGLRHHAQDAGLTLSLMHIDRTIEGLDGGTWNNSMLWAAIEETRNRITDELSQLLIMRIPVEKARYYDKPDAFGPEVEKRFPDASYDIRQAGNAYSTGCNTGCVFHLMRAVEFGIRTLAIGLGITNIEKPWGPLLVEMRAALATKRANGSITRDEHDRYAGVVALLENVKDAWRNPTMHPAAKYDEAEALDVYSAVKSFMVNVTTKI